MTLPDTIAPVLRRPLLPRLEFLLLAVALCCNTLGKYIALARRSAASPLALAEVVSQDVVFFALVALVCVFILSSLPPRIAGRANLLLSCIACGWSGANLGWLSATGAQIHVGVVASLLSNP